MAGHDGRTADGGGGCTSDGEASASCSGVVTYENRDHPPTDKAGFTVGERLGTATIVACDDSPEDGEGRPEGKTSAYAVEGADPAEAIAVGDTPHAARLIEMH
ncbi:DUF6281 family protein [Streptomyces fulvoviolaceus]|uniref:DUF6281 family protein n=1 Tax=Streptomyces fulvoviolaceus TaxID=285535 RepID=UPI00069363C2|nr:DUF6281 family protein [Streptomyces fulvoviolaceus]